LQARNPGETSPVFLQLGSARTIALAHIVDHE
jgi:hypothetical protein